MQKRLAKKGSKQTTAIASSLIEMEKPKYQGYNRTGNPSNGANRYNNDAGNKPFPETQSQNQPQNGNWGGPTIRGRGGSNRGEYRGTYSNRGKYFEFIKTESQKISLVTEKTHPNSSEPSKLTDKENKYSRTEK